MRMGYLRRVGAGLVLLVLIAGRAAADERAGLEWFESRIRPVLVERCYSCHSARAAKLKGDLRLDTRDGVRRGGENGPVIDLQRPNDSSIIRALRHDGLAMPPDRKLPDAVVTDFVRWIQMGAPDPRTVDAATAADADWEVSYRQRLDWWSLRPVVSPPPPAAVGLSRARSDVDLFLLAKLRNAGATFAPPADRMTVIRRLTFLLTGLPPTPDEVDRFLSDDSPAAYEALVDRLLASPRFGERWARHWMDVIHYADTHGYEWDVPAKGAWRYRDYLVRAFNEDVSYRQMVLEQLAGDQLAEPRINPSTRVNESLIGTVALRMGERRHGDSAEFEGIHQESLDNVVDTIGKAFQSLTIACARCHDHKLDALSQRDYYAVYGVLMSTRWVCRTVDVGDPNAALYDELLREKTELRRAVAERWLSDSETFARTLVAAQAAIDQPAGVPVGAAPEGVGNLPAERVEAWKKLLAAKPAQAELLAYPWSQLAIASAKKESISAEWDKLRTHYTLWRTDRRAANAKNSRVIADFTMPGQLPAGWHVEGLGMTAGWARDGELIVAEEGDQAVRQILPAGLYSHRFSPRLAGAIRSPLLAPDTPFLSVEYLGGGIASQHVVVDNALFPEARYRFLDQPDLGLLTVSTLPGDTQKGRRVWLELNTKALNNYFPARVGLTAKYSPREQDDPRSWIGVSRVHAHAEPGQAPLDDLGRFERLLAPAAPETLAAAAQLYQDWLRGPIERWRDDRADAADIQLLNTLLRAGLVTNRHDMSASVAQAVGRYRAVEARVAADQVVGGMAEYAEGRDDRLAIRGSYTDLGPTVPRGYVRLLAQQHATSASPTSGRLELAETIASPDNPLTARVFVNRVWHHLFGAGLVASVDEFGHIGQPPAHPELLDYLAARFVNDGWSVKNLVRDLVLSDAWRQSGTIDPAAAQRDPENRLLHHYPLRRLEAEAIRDAMLASSGRLDRALGGPPIDPYRTAEDKEKRLIAGPLDGLGRRSLYLKMTLMEPPRFLALFNQPLPKLTVGKRDVTNVPDQALALLNDPFVADQARRWAEGIVGDGAGSVAGRLDGMFRAALSRPPSATERQRFEQLVQRLASEQQVASDKILSHQELWRHVAHTLFNLKEFVYVR